MNKNDRHIGGGFDSFLAEEGILEEVEAVAAKRVIAWQLAQEMEAKHITKRAMAETLHTSRSQIARLLDPENASVHLTTLARAAHAVGMRVKIGLVPVTVASDVVRASAVGRRSSAPHVHSKR